MSTQQSSHRGSMALHNLTNLLAVVFLAAAFYLFVWPLLVERFAGVTPMPLALPTAVVAPRPYQAPPLPQVQQPAAPVIAPTPYTMEDANRAADEAYKQAVEQAELNSAPLPNASKEVGESWDPINLDWCRGSHLSRPECQPGNGSKEE